MEDRLMTPGEIGKRYGYTPDAVRGWERRGLVQATKTVSGRRLFRARDIERFIAQRGRRKALAVERHRPRAHEAAVP